jgi:hypothetical protein
MNSDKYLKLKNKNIKLTNKIKYHINQCNNNNSKYDYHYLINLYNKSILTLYKMKIMIDILDIQ